MGGKAMLPTTDLLKKVKRHLHDSSVYGTLSVDEGGGGAAPAAQAKPGAEGGEAPAAAPSTMITFKDSETGQKIRVGWEADLKAVANKIIKQRK